MNTQLAPGIQDNNINIIFHLKIIAIRQHRKIKKQKELNCSN